MYESGYYPAGAEFDPRAPWNEREPTMVECAACGGKGYHCTPTTLRQTTKQNVPKKHGKICEVCDGEGEVEYEPDYDDYDED